MRDVDNPLKSLGLVAASGSVQVGEDLPGAPHGAALTWANAQERPQVLSAAAAAAAFACVPQCFGVQCVCRCFGSGRAACALTCVRSTRLTWILSRKLPGADATVRRVLRRLVSGAPHWLGAARAAATDGLPQFQRNVGPANAKCVAALCGRTPPIALGAPAVLPMLACSENLPEALHILLMTRPFFVGRWQLAIAAKVMQWCLTVLLTLLVGCGFELVTVVSVPDFYGRFRASGPPCPPSLQSPPPRFKQLCPDVPDMLAAYQPGSPLTGTD